MATSNFVILFDGVKTLWEIKMNLNVLIVYHSSFMCLEIVSYDSSTGLEFPRIYVSYGSVLNKIHHEAIELEVKKEIELHLRNHTGYDEDKIYQSFTRELVVNYVLSRIQISADGQTGERKVFLQCHSDNHLDNHPHGRIDIQCDKPLKLEPFKLLRRLHSSFKEFTSKLNEMSDDTSAIDAECAAAGNYLEEVGTQLEIERRLSDESEKSTHHLTENKHYAAAPDVYHIPDHPMLSSSTSKSLPHTDSRHGPAFTTVFNPHGAAAWETIESTPTTAATDLKKHSESAHERSSHSLKRNDGHK